jgi:hypothetical protein
MASATEPFPDAGKMPFGQSFEEKIKQRNGTVKIISAANAKKPNQQFFRRGKGFLHLPSMAGCPSRQPETTSQQSQQLLAKKVIEDQVCYKT